MNPSPGNLECTNCAPDTKGIFCGLQPSMLESISQNKITNIYKRGQNLFLQGNPAFGLYCINKGKVKVSKSGPDGRESIVRIASAGDIIGHRAIFSHQNYTATATALEETHICFIHKDLLFETLQASPGFALRIIEKLSREMGEAEERSASMFHKNVRERLAAFFLKMKNEYGIKDNNRTRLDIKLSREEIGSIIGTAPETVIRLIAEFKETGLIAQEGKTLYVVSEKGLREFANL